MKKMTISLMTALLLMIATFVPFSKAIAAVKVEYLLLPVYLAFNKNTESLELIYLPKPSSQAKPTALLPDDEFQVRFFVTPIAETGGDPTCTQIFQTPVTLTAGLNVMTLAIDGTKLVVNGESVEEELDHDCFDNVDRVLIWTGGPVLPGSDPSVLPAVHPQFGNVTVVDKAGGGTKATSSWIGEGANVFIEEVQTR